MEATLEQQIEKLLIREDIQSITKLTDEVIQRRDLLNKILSAGLTAEEILKVTNSVDTINAFVFQKNVDGNKELRKLINAGIQGITAELPSELVALKYDLLAWHGYPVSRRGGDLRYQHLILKDGRFEINMKSLEDHFEKASLKIYVSGDKLAEFRELESLCTFLMKYEFPVSDLKQSHFFNKRLEFYDRNSIRPRYSHFVN